jgi:omega-amidase
MSNLHIHIIQSNLAWEKPSQNREYFAQQILQINKPADIIVLPEMFSTGFSMNTSFAEDIQGTTIQWMHQQASKTNAAICGSLMIVENNKYYNRFVWMPPDGSMVFYDKRHLFSMGKENQYYAAGEQKLIVAYKGLNILLATCYDLRFPVWLRRTAKDNYDALLIVANWPEPRAMHWKTLLQARAIENQVFVIACNRVGIDGNGMNHAGDSGIISPKGEWLLHMNNIEQTAYAILNNEDVIAWRNAFPAQADADTFSLA